MIGSCGWLYAVIWTELQRKPFFRGREIGSWCVEKQRWEMKNTVHLVIEKTIHGFLSSSSLLSFPFYSWVNWGSQRLNNQAGGEGRPQSRCCLTSCGCLWVGTEWGGKGGFYLSFYAQPYSSMLFLLLFCCFCFVFTTSLCSHYNLKRVVTCWITMCIPKLICHCVSTVPR